MESRVTLRGLALSEKDRLRAGAIAIKASQLEGVDNQIEISPAS